MEIVCFPDKSLRRRAHPVKKIGDDERKILSEMANMMYLKGGVGLAAIQVGIQKSLIVADIGDGVMKLANPIITKREGSEAQEEGCLSLPETCVKVRRAKRIVVEYLNEFGLASRLTAEGLLARVIQHEADHLEGKLIIDYLNPLKKLCNSLTIRKL